MRCEQTSHSHACDLKDRYAAMVRASSCQNTLCVCIAKAIQA